MVQVGVSLGVRALLFALKHHEQRWAVRSTEEEVIAGTRVVKGA